MKTTEPATANIPLSEWDAIHANRAPLGLSSAMRQAGDYPTMAGLVCIAKEAARQLAEAR